MRAHECGALPGGLTVKNILFVDDEVNVLNGLRRMLRNRKTEWNMEFVDSGAKALVLLEEKPFDVIVSDMRMPGMSGARPVNEYPWQVPGNDPDCPVGVFRHGNGAGMH